MRYRLEEYHPDADFEALVARLLEDPTELELVFNGDLFDFDTPWVKDGDSSHDEFPVDGEGCAGHAARIVSDHAGWFRATARVLRAGHRVLFMSGNHDVEMVFPSVRAVLRRALVEHARTLAEAEGAPPPSPAEEDEMSARVRFRAWFHVTEDGIYFEHGSQYDLFNAVRWAMMPFSRERRAIHPVMGKLAFKRLGARMGYFNPYYEETFYAGFTEHAAHFLKFYARSRRHIIRLWVKGALRTVGEIWRHRHDDDWDAEDTDLARAETGATPDAIRRTRALAIRPAEVTMVPILRELWLDRTAIVTLSIVLVLASAAVGWPFAAITAAVVAALFVAYEIVTPKPDLRTYDQAPATVRALWDIHGARAICMGHTHRPFAHWVEGRFHGNSGAWCPAFKDQLCTQPVLDRRPVLLLTTEGETIRGGLHWWDGVALRPDGDPSRSDDAVVGSPVLDYHRAPCPNPTAADHGA